MRWVFIFTVLFLAIGCITSEPDASDSPPVVTALSGPLSRYVSVPGATEMRVPDTVLGGEIYVYQAGPAMGEPLVLVHGIGDDASRTWLHVISKLAQTYRVLTFDLPGFGQSTRGAKLYTTKSYVEIIHNLTQRFVKRPFILAGHSLGASVSLRYSATFPEDVRRLVIVDAAGILHRAAFLKERPKGLLTNGNMPSNKFLYAVNMFVLRRIETIERLSVNPGTLTSSAWMRQHILAGNESVIAAMALMDDNFSGILSKVRDVPTFILWGAEDQVAPLRTGIALHHVLPASILHVFPHRAHAAMNEAPHEFEPSFLAAVNGDLKEDTLPSARAVVIEGNCRNQKGAVFEGNYDRLLISGCKDVHINNAFARQLLIENSEAGIVNSSFRSESNTATLINSEVEMTGVKIQGDIALSLNSSRIDLAGVELIGNTAALSEIRVKRTSFFSSIFADAGVISEFKDSRSSLIVSISHIQSKVNRDRWLHGRQLVRRDEDL